MAGSRSSKNTKQDSKKIICHKCNKELVATSNNFYQTNSEFFQMYGLLPVCKKCMQEYYQELLDENDDEIYLAVVEFFRTFDLYFSDDLFEMAIKERETWVNKGRKNVPDHWSIMIGKLNSMSKYKKLTWKNCKGSDVYAIDKIDNDNMDLLKSKERIVLKEKWGDNYNDKELLKLEKFFDDMQRMYKIETPQHLISLKLITKMQKKMDDYLEEGDISNFEKINKTYSKTLADSGLRPIDKKSSSMSTGIVNFGNLYEMIEQDGFIKPDRLGESQDIVDHTIMYMLNYWKNISGESKLISPPTDTPKVEDFLTDNGDKNEL